MHIHYYQQDGRVGVKYDIDDKEMDEVMDQDLVRPFPAEDPWYEEIDLGFVPRKVQAQGEEMVQAYAEKICRRRHGRNLAQAKKIRDGICDRRRNVNRIILASHDGIALKGRMVNYENGGVIVWLEEPLKTEKGCVFDYPHSYAASMAGMHVFNNDGELTSVVLEDAGKALIRLYKEEVARREYGEAVCLVGKLNGRAV